MLPGLSFQPAMMASPSAEMPRAELLCSVSGVSSLCRRRCMCLLPHDCSSPRARAPLHPRSAAARGLWHL